VLAFEEILSGLGYEEQQRSSVGKFSLIAFRDRSSADTVDAPGDWVYAAQQRAAIHSKFFSLTSRTIGSFKKTIESLRSEMDGVTYASGVFGRSFCATTQPDWAEIIVMVDPEANLWIRRLDESLP